MVFSCDCHKPPNLVGACLWKQSGLIKPVMNHTCDVDLRPAHKDPANGRYRAEICLSPGGNRDFLSSDFDDEIAEETTVTVRLSFDLEGATDKTSRRGHVKTSSQARSNTVAYF
jgi:hypothetical protein